MFLNFTEFYLLNFKFHRQSAVVDSPTDIEKFTFPHNFNKKKTHNLVHVSNNYKLFSAIIQK